MVALGRSPVLLRAMSAAHQSGPRWVWNGLCLLVAMLAFPAVPYAQPAPCNITLSGQVIDDHDRTPLSFATVYIPELERGTVSDEQGGFRVDGLCPGRYMVRITHVGCEPVERRIDLTADVRMDFRLEHHHEELHEMEVVRKRPDENVGQTRSELDAAELQKRSGSGLAELLSTLPGVYMTGAGPTIGKPVIQGHSGNRVVVLDQGVRQEDQQWGADHAPDLDPLTADRITVVKGAASVQYGADAIGGVVITEAAGLPRKPGLGGEVRTLGVLNGRGGGLAGMLQGGVGHVRGLGWRVQGSGRMTGDAEAPDYSLSNTGMRQLAGSATAEFERHRGGATVRYSFFTRELGVLRAAHIGNLTDLENAIASQRPWYVAPFSYDIDAPRQQAMHHMLKAEGRYRLAERSLLKLTYGHQVNDRQEYDVRRGGRTGRPSLDLYLRTHTADAVLNHWLGARVHGKVGISGIHQENYNMPGTGVRPLIPNYLKRSGGLFIVEHFPINDRLELEAGGRLEGTRLQVGRYDAGNVFVTPEHRFINHAFSGGGNWTVRDSMVVRFNISSAFRPPHVSELYSEGLHHGAAAIELGDDQLNSERSVKLSADMDAWWLKGRLRTQLTVYMDQVQDYILLQPSGTRITIRGTFPVFQHVATDARIAGADALLEYHFTDSWGWRATASMLRGQDLRNGGWLFQMPADRVANSLLWRRARAGAWKELEIAATSTYVWQQTRVPVDLDLMDPPAGYHLLSLSCSTARPMGKGELRFGVEGTNLLNTAYRDYMDRFRYFADARGLDVVVWVRYRFGV